MTSVPRIPPVTFGRRPHPPLQRRDTSLLTHPILRIGACEQKLADLFRAMETRADGGREECQREGGAGVR